MSTPASALRLYNTLTRRVEPFVPLDPTSPTMYVCGPTVYNYVHIGNARGPVVFVTNPFAGSDGDIVAAAAQELGLGPVVGERSWGGVVGIDGRFSLVDGTEVTQPRYWISFDKIGFGLENNGVEPDITVEVGPAEWESESDVQLDAAIDEALKRLAERPAATPPTLPDPRFG